MRKREAERDRERRRDSERKRETERGPHSSNTPNMTSNKVTVLLGLIIQTTECPLNFLIVIDIKKIDILIYVHS